MREDGVNSKILINALQIVILTHCFINLLKTQFAERLYRTTGHSSPASRV